MGLDAHLAGVVAAPARTPVQFQLTTFDPNQERYQKQIKDSDPIHTQAIIHGKHGR
jgi:hypothetical protein